MLLEKKDSYSSISESLILMILEGDTIAEINKDKLFLKTWKKFPPQKEMKKAVRMESKCSTCCYKVVLDPLEQFLTES